MRHALGRFELAALGAGLAGILACGDPSAGPDSDAGTATSGSATGEPTSGPEMSTGSHSDETTTSASSVSSSGAGECASVEECTAQGPCRAALACAGGICEYEELPAGAPLADPVAGDCMKLICDGRGGSESVADPNDVEDDGIQCTLDTCEGGIPKHSPGMAPCYSGPAETVGVGVCASGAQLCDEDDQPFGPCMGEVLPGVEVCDGGLTDEDCDGVANEADAGCTCTDGETQPCYTGPPGTEGVGACAAGLRSCEGGAWGPCTGEALPGDEDCDGAIDEDCDGAIDEEGPSCVCGDGAVSNDEACDDGNANADDACTPACEAQEVLQMALGSDHTCALLSGGKLKCWGHAGNHKLGFEAFGYVGDAPGEMGDALPVIDLGVGKAAEAVRAGTFVTCALLSGGALKCWGSAYRIGLGQPPGIIQMLEMMGDSLPTIDLGAGAVAVDVHCGRDHTCVLLEGGKVKCFGGNDFGELGLGDIKWRGVVAGEMGDDLPFVDLGAGAEVVQLRTAASFSCARLSTGVVKCWGRNFHGALGQGDAENRGDAPGEMGDSLPAVDLGPGAEATWLTVGSEHACVLLEGGAVKCWGDNDSGQLGLGDQLHRGDEPGEMGDALPALNLGPDELIDIEAFGATTCARFVGGAVKCWGFNAAGSLGIGDANDRGDDPGEMGDALQAIDFGAGKTVASLDGHGLSGHVCAAFTDGSAKCWGQNTTGELGLGDKLLRGNKPGQMGDALPTVKLFTKGW